MPLALGLTAGIFNNKLVMRDLRSSQSVLLKIPVLWDVKAVLLGKKRGPRWHSG
jgi:hypothetical protein